jgi:flagellar biogenesis protein FliO
MTPLYMVAALVALLGALIWAVKRWGRAEAQKENATTALSQASKSHGIDEAVSRLDDRTLDQRLRDAGE